MKRTRLVSYQSAIQKANDIIRVINFICTNPEYLDDKRNDAISFSSIYDTSRSNNYNTVELYYDYVCVNKNDTVLRIETDDDFSLYPVDEAILCSSEEGYFQMSTIYDSEVLDNLCLFGTLFTGTTLNYFYLDYEHLEFIIKFITDEEAAFKK